MDVHAIRKYCTIGGLIGRDKSQVNNYSHSGVIAVVAYQSHKLEVVGSSPTPATNNINTIYYYEKVYNIFYNCTYWDMRNCIGVYNK